MEAAMEDQANQAQDEAQPPPPPQPPSSESQPQSQSQGDEDEEEEPRNEDDELIAKAQKLMEKITSSPENPSSFVLHALASLLETQESRYRFSLSLSLSMCFMFYMPLYNLDHFYFLFRS